MTLSTKCKEYSRQVLSEIVQQFKTTGLTITNRPDRLHPDDNTLISRLRRHVSRYTSTRIVLICCFLFNDNSGKVRLIISASIPETTELL